MTIRMLMCLSLFVSFSCFGAEIEEALSRAGLVESTIPTGDAWRAANRHLIDYVVANDGGQLTIKEVKNLRQPRDIQITFKDQVFIGTNKGEWGGNLAAVGADGTNHILIHGNVVQIIRENDELFVFTGLAHGVSAHGALYKVTRDNDHFIAEKLTLLPGAPEVVAIERNDRGYFGFLVVTNDGLVSFSPSFSEMKVLAIYQFWHGLYPTSAYLLGNQLIIGMRSGVAVVSMDQNISLGSMPRVKKVQYFSKKAQGESQ